MLHRRMMITAVAGLLLVAAAPALAADAASPNDTARFLAGLPPAAESPLAPLAEDRAWQQHATTFNSTFERVDQSQLARIRTWSGSNISAARPTLFYMFSGPDFLYANAFYPKAKTYVLAGLEPVGAVPDITKLRGSLGTDLSQLRTSLRWILQYSYFITSQMSSDLRRGRLTGTLPVLLRVPGALGQDHPRGHPVKPRRERCAAAGRRHHSASIPARGVKIVFAGSDGEERTLYYFSTDLSNGGVDKSKFLDFLETLAPGDGLVKSASYLLHNPGFSKVRDFLLAHSAAMVQDDTGIPLARYDAQKWELQPFGKYVGPIPVFRGMYNSKYAALFKNAPPIDFGIGYRWRPNQSNLLLAVKKPGVSMSERRPARRPGNSARSVTDPGVPGCNTHVSYTMLQRRTITHRHRRPVAHCGRAGARRRRRIPERYRALPRRHAACRRLSARGADQGRQLAAACQRLRRGVPARRQQPTRADPRLVEQESSPRRGRPCSTSSAVRTSSTPTLSTPRPRPT